MRKQRGTQRDTDMKRIRHEGASERCVCRMRIKHGKNDCLNKKDQIGSYAKYHAKDVSKCAK